MAEYIIEEISSSQDPLWAVWKEIYYDSFPENERMSDGHFESVLESKSRGGDQNTHILIMDSTESESPESDGGVESPVALAYYEHDRELRTGFLWYLATRAGLRGRGVGVELYRRIRASLRAAGAAMLVFEVEIPPAGNEGSDGATEAQEWAARRIAWYQRQGACVLEGVQYFQTVDTGVPATEMHLMVDAFENQNAEDTFALCKSMFGDSLTLTGALGLRCGSAI